MPKGIGYGKVAQMASKKKEAPKEDKWAGQNKRTRAAIKNLERAGLTEGEIRRQLGLKKKG